MAVAITCQPQILEQRTNAFPNPTGLSLHAHGTKADGSSTNEDCKDMPFSAMAFAITIYRLAHLEQCCDCSFPLSARIASVDLIDLGPQ